MHDFGRFLGFAKTCVRLDGWSIRRNDVIGPRGRKRKQAPTQDNKKSIGETSPLSAGHTISCCLGGCLLAASARGPMTSVTSNAPAIQTHASFRKA